jgi:hypothetical protein
MRTTTRIVLAGLLSSLCLSVVSAPQAAEASGRMPIYCCH